MVFYSDSLFLSRLIVEVIWASVDLFGGGFSLLAKNRLSFNYNKKTNIFFSKFYSVLTKFGHPALSSEFYNYALDIKFVDAVSMLGKI